MTRFVSLVAAIILATFILTSQAAAGSILPHIHLPKINLVPKINLGKSVAAVAYPVTKAVVNGGKTILKAGAVADTLGVVPNIGPPAVSHFVKKMLWGVGRH